MATSPSLNILIVEDESLLLMLLEELLPVLGYEVAGSVGSVRASSASPWFWTIMARSPRPKLPWRRALPAINRMMPVRETYPSVDHHVTVRNEAV